MSQYTDEERERRAYQRYIWRVRAGCQPEDEQEAKQLQDLDWEIAKMDMELEGKVVNG